MKALAFAVSMLGLSGCGFIEGVSHPEEDRVIYIGTVRDVEHITGERRHGNSCLDLTRVFIPFYIIDLPISFALDTGFLPFTVLYELLRPAPSPEGDIPAADVKLPPEKK